MRFRGFGEIDPADDPGNYVDVVTVNAQEAPRVRTVDELAALVKAAPNARLTVGANSSNLIVALNNTMRFAIERTPAGDYAITDKGNSEWLLIGGVAALFLVVLIASR